MMTQEMIKDTTLLRFVDFADLNLWDVKRYKAGKLKSDFKIVLLGKYINEETTKLKPQDYPNQEFKILGVNNKTGIFDAYIQPTSEIKQAYKKMEIGWIAYNPYRVNVGSIGMRTNKHKHDLISPAYVVFSCKPELNPDYLYKLFKTKKFNQIIRDNTTGSVRQNLTFDILEKIKIPLPKHEEQEQILKEYYKKINLAKKWENKAKQLEEYIDEYLSQKLDIEYKITNKEKGHLFFIDFKDINRWDIWTKIEIAKSRKYPNKTLNDIVTNQPTYGANVKGTNEKKDTRYIRITDINEDGTLNDEVVYPEIVEEKYLLKENDFLIARSGNTVGKTFLYKKKYGKCIYAGYLVKYHINKKIALPDYVLLFSKSKVFKQWIEANQRISGQPNINGQEFLKSPIILPSIDIQEEIVLFVNRIKSLIKKLKQNAKYYRIKAITDFEKTVIKE